MKKLPLLIIFFPFIAYSNIGYKIGHANLNQVKDQQSGLQINTFTDIPKDIDGLAGYFSKSISDRKSKRYICVTDFGSLAYVKINGKLIRFNVTKRSKILYLFQDLSKSTQLTIQINSSKPSGPEESAVTGIITVQTSAIKKTSISFVGYIGE